MPDAPRLAHVGRHVWIPIHRGWVPPDSPHWCPACAAQLGSDPQAGMATTFVRLTREYPTRPAPGNRRPAASAGDGAGPKPAPPPIKQIPTEDRKWKRLRAAFHSLKGLS